MPNDRDMKNFPPTGGIFTDLFTRIKLVLRLLADPRISPWLKILPLGSALYFVIPDFVPGPIDDVAVIWFGVYFFVEMCPPEIVQEHMDTIQQVVPGTRQEPIAKEYNPDQVVDGEIRDKQ
jgi:uncharacterized membrane protein YkvA (DUF1232 family)